MIKLCLSDMDNTLIPLGRGVASWRTIAAIHAVQREGVIFGPSTGRDRGELNAFFDGDESCFDTGVLCNGQKVYLKGKVVKEVYLEPAALRKIEAMVLETPGTAMITYRPDTFGDWVGAKREELGHMYDLAFMVGGEWHERLPEYPVIKAGIIHMGTEEQLHAFQARLEEAVPECAFNNTIEHWLDITPRNWSKVEGVKYLAQAFGVTMDEVCVFGDADNDLSMLLWVPRSCAMANANENAAASAAYRIPRSQDDGVAWALEQIADAAKITRLTGEDTLPRFMQDA